MNQKSLPADGLSLSADENKLIQLTDWESGGSVLIRLCSVVSMRRLPAKVCEPIGCGDTAQELGARTRIDTKSDLILVRESPEEIMESAKR